MLTLEWVMEQLERTRTGTQTMQAARDFALLCICRDELQSMQQPRETEAPKKNPPLRGLDEIEEAISQYTVRTPEERQRVRDAKTVTGLMKNKTQNADVNSDRNEMM